MKAPLIAVTGPIASGKTTVAGVMARGGGCIVDADLLAHEVYHERGLKKRLREHFGESIFTRGGKISRKKLGRLVFSDESALEKLDSIVRSGVKKIITERVRALRKTERYIVLDAVLFFKYKFTFKTDLTVRTEASREIRVRRLMRRDGFSREEAELRIESQRKLARDWEKADIVINTDGGLHCLEKEASRIRDEFIAAHCAPGGKRNGR